MPKIGDIKFDSSGHIYKVWNGTKWRNVPSVSKIKGQLDKPALMSWAAKITAEYCVKEVMPLIASGQLQLTPDDYEKLFTKAKNWTKEKSKEATDIGKEVHRAIEEYTIRKTAPVGLTDTAQKSFNAYLEWEKDAHLGRIVATEMPFYSRDYNFCGTFDRLCYLNEKLYIIDYKTSKDFYDIDMALQLAGYKLGVDELLKRNELPEMLEGATVDGVGVLRLDKTTGFPYFKDYTEYIQIGTNIFLLLRDLLELTIELQKINPLKII